MARILPLAIALTIALAGCGDALSNALTPPRVVDRQPHPDDRRVEIGQVRLSPDKRAVTLDFTGGKPFDPNDPCSTDYVAVGEVRDDILEVAAIETVSSGEMLPEQPADGIFCTAEGHARTVVLQLPEPFLGSTVHDLAGYVRFLAAPNGLVELTGLPQAWKLRAENDVGGSPTGRWQRRYAPTEDVPSEGTLGVLDFYQAFGGPVSVSGGDEVRSVAIGEAGGAIGTLYRQGESGELVLTWDVEGTSLALVADERDFPAAALIALAASARLPRD